MWRRTVFVLVLLCCGRTLAGARGDSTDAIKNLISKAQRGKSVISAHFCDADSGRTLFSYKADLPMTPASNMKIVTTAAAVDRLGPQFAYETLFGLWGDNLVIIGGGDPLTGEAGDHGDSDDVFRLFAALAETLSERKLKTIPGDLIIDDTLFDDERFHPSWDIKQANKWYAAQVSALNFNANCVDITVRPGASAGGLAKYRTRPETAYVEITNKAVTKTSRSNTTWAARKANSNQITLRGGCRNEQEIRVAIDRPSAYFGFVLAEYLLARGITIEGTLIVRPIRLDQGVLPEGIDWLLSYRTELTAVLTTCNQRSGNWAAECLFKTLGADTGRAGSWASGREAVGAFLGKLDVPEGQFQLDDGCGLSPQNRLSARTLTSVLTYMHNHQAAEVFRESLATPEMGTLSKKRRFSEPMYRGRIYAKTGYISGARALSGYYRTKRDRWLAFAVLANNGTTNKDIDAIVKKAIQVLSAKK